MASKNNDLWFKVAIIFVPILGIIIVILLIILAIKMLKSDGLEASFKNAPTNDPASKHVVYGLKTVIIENGVLHDYDANTSLLVQPTSSSTNTNCDKKNENLAKRNQLLSLENRLLPASFQDPGVKLLNTEEGVTNNFYSKNFNTLQQKPIVKQITNNVKGDKICDKEFLNPVAASWSTGG